MSSADLSDRICKSPILHSDIYFSFDIITSEILSLSLSMELLFRLLIIVSI